MPNFFKKIVNLVWLLSLFLPLSLALYSADPTFGPEWTLTNDTIIKSENGSSGRANLVKEAKQNLRRKFIKMALHQSPGGLRPQLKTQFLNAVLLNVHPKVRDTVAAEWNTILSQITQEIKEMAPAKDYKYKFEFSSNAMNDLTISFKDIKNETTEPFFWLNLSHDVSVIEFQAKPITLSEWKDPRIEAIVSELVFGHKNDLNLAPDVINGGGHIHLGYESTFGKNFKLFRNFLVDFFNHSELGMGIFGHDIRNAKPVSYYSKSIKKLLIQLITKLDLSLLKNENVDREEMAQELQKIYARDTEQMSPKWKYVMTNVDKMAAGAHTQETVELRIFAPQKDFATYLLQLDLISDRIQWLELKTNEGLFLQLEIPKKDINNQSIVNRYFTFVNEMKTEKLGASSEKWKVYQKLIEDKELQGIQAIFEGRSQWNAAAAHCSHLRIDMVSSIKMLLK